MKVQVNSLNTFYRLLDWIFPIYFLIYLIEFYLGIWRLSTLVKLVIILITLFYSGMILRQSNNKGDFYKLFSLYYLYCIFSGIWYVVNDIPFSCYLNELFNSLPAMFYVYVGMADKREDGKFYENFMKYCSIAMLIGLVLYFTTPGWFIQRSIEVYESQSYQGTTSESTLLATMRFKGFFKNVYEADMYAMVALSISLFLYFSKSNKEKDYLLYVMVLINLIAAVLTQQRVAMVSAIFTFLFYMGYGFIRKKASKSSKIILRTGIISIIVLVISIAYMGDRVEQIQVLLEDRKENMDVVSALNERSNQHESIWNNWTMPVFGKGAGSGGANAGLYGLPHINDGCYLQLLYEYGIMGFVLFVLIMIKTILKATHYFKYYLTELVIVFFVLVAMLGSNTLSIGYMLIIPFWYSVGRIWNKEHRKFIIENDVKV